MGWIDGQEYACNCCLWKKGAREVKRAERGGRREGGREGGKEGGREGHPLPGNWRHAIGV